MSRGPGTPEGPRCDLRLAPPRDLAELRARAEDLTGRDVDDLAAKLGFRVRGTAARTKGKIGELIERALGASGGSLALQDFPDLGVELKTVPLDPRGWPRESTFVCSISVADADEAEWATSWTRLKLSHVLWVPIAVATDGPRRVGSPLFWRPTEEQDAVLRGDFEDAMGRIGRGDVEGVSAHLGRWLQVRPKAAHGRVRTAAFGVGGERIDTIPRGFYLRARFTGALLSDPGALPA